MDLDVEYDNGARVPGLPQIIEQWQRDAQEFRNQNEGQLDLSYGEHDRQKADLFGVDQQNKKPLVIFIHGGYWRMLGREVSSHMAAGLNQHGNGVVIPSYQLCPAATIADTIEDMRLLCAWVWRQYERKIVVTGHSAGGHLAACMVATNWQEYDLPADLVSTGLAISGLFDLRPLLATKLNETLGLTEKTARQSSPLLWPSPGKKRFEAWVGGDESAEFIRQSDTLAACWSGAGTQTNSVHVTNKNHFTVIDDLVDANSEMTRMIVQLAEQI